MFEVVGAYRGRDIYKKIDTNKNSTGSYMLLFVIGDLWTVLDEECLENKRWYITGKCLGAPELTKVWNIWNGENRIEDPKITVQLPCNWIDIENTETHEMIPVKKQKMINVYGKYVFTDISSSGYPI